VDDMGREYIPMANDDRWTEHGWYNVRMPLALYRDKEKRAEVGFPDRGDTVVLRGRRKMMTCIVDDGPSAVSKTLATALIKLDIKSEQDDIG